MNAALQMTGSNSRLKTILFKVALVWTAIMVILVSWEQWSAYITVIESAKASASESFRKDLVYRRWATSHGGVYVPVTEQSPPNPYLVDIPERDITTPSGKKLTLVNPAYMTRQVHEIGNMEYGSKGHITSLRPLRPENAPDPWEREALKTFEEGVKEVSSIETSDGVTYFRFMGRLIAEQPCLKCHAKQGYKVGEIRGGISVSLPWATYRDELMHQLRVQLAVFGIMWIVGLAALSFGGGRIGHHLAERRRAEQALELVVQEKSGLLKEVHHRVKNNLQVIVSLLRLEGGRSTYADTKVAFAEMTGRIRSMALLHESLYHTGTSASVDLGEYLDRLAEQVFKSQVIHSDKVQLKRDMGSVYAGMDQAISCGLLVNELISNCLKHGFPNERQGVVSVELQPAGQDGLWCLKVADTGVGLSPDFEDRRKTSLGLQLVDDLSGQMGGTLNIESVPGLGVQFSVVFSVMDPASLVISS